MAIERVYKMFILYGVLGNIGFSSDDHFSCVLQGAQRLEYGRRSNIKEPSRKNTDLKIYDICQVDFPILNIIDITFQGMEAGVLSPNLHFDGSW